VRCLVEAQTPGCCELRSPKAWLVRWMARGDALRAEAGYRTPPYPCWSPRFCVAAGNLTRIRAHYFSRPDDARAALRRKLQAFLNGTWEREIARAPTDTVFAAFTVALNAGERRAAADAAARVGSANRAISAADYPREMGRALFVLAPGGAGMDVHRVTEAVAAGALPILREKFWPAEYYDGWPHVVIPNWEDLTMPWLRTAAAEALQQLEANQFDFRRAYAPYQLARVRREQARARAWCAEHLGGSNATAPASAAALLRGPRD